MDSPRSGCHIGAAAFLEVPWQAKLSTRWWSRSASRSESRPVEPELSPPCALDEPAEIRSALVFSSPHSGNVYPATFLADSPPRCDDASPVGGRVRGGPVLRRRRGRGAAPESAISQGLSRRQPRALRARPAHVRRQAPVLCQYALDAGRRRIGHDRPHCRRVAGNLFPPPPRPGGSAACRGTL